MSDPGDIIAEMAREIDRLKLGHLEMPSTVEAIARACWAVVEKRMGWRPKVRYTRTMFYPEAAEHRRICAHPLYQFGDTILVWVNEGDILLSGELIDPPPSSAEEGESQNR